MLRHLARGALVLGLLAPLAAADNPHRPHILPPPAPGSTDRPAPAQAASAGFDALIFETNFSTVKNLTDVFSCLGGDQSKPWKQGLWYEANEATGMAPCSQITLAQDAALGGQALDLAWLAAGNKDSVDNTAITTFPIDTVSPHFAFHRGYVEVVARATNPTNAGIWASSWMLGDGAVISDNIPPFVFTVPLVELDIAELHGVSQLDSAIYESPQGGTNQYIGPNNNPTTGFDFSAPHVYGFLWETLGQGKGGQVCSYLDNALRGCAPTTASTEGQPFFLILSVGSGCNFTPGDRTCMAGLARSDLFVSRVSVWGAAKGNIE
jgi:hypothetical protein